MKVVILAPFHVKRELAGAISAYDPRKSGPDQRVKLARNGFAGLIGEDPPPDRVLECRWELDRDAKTAYRQWKVTVGPPEAVAELEKSFTHHFDDPLDVR